jgi:hypothetical protein
MQQALLLVVRQPQQKATLFLFKSKLPTQLMKLAGMGKHECNQLRFFLSFNLGTRRMFLDA